MIYFLRKGMSGPIKIGYAASDPKRRMRTLQTGSEKKLFFIGVIDGSMRDEHSLHSLLAEFRQRSEWFKPTYPVLKLIREKLRQQDEKDVASLGYTLTRQAYPNEWTHGLPVDPLIKIVGKASKLAIHYYRKDVCDSLGNAIGHEDTVVSRKELLRR